MRLHQYFAKCSIVIKGIEGRIVVRLIIMRVAWAIVVMVMACMPGIIMMMMRYHIMRLQQRKSAKQDDEYGNPSGHSQMYKLHDIVGCKSYRMERIDYQLDP